MANKKPTMKEVKTVIDNMLIHMSYLDIGLKRLDSALSSYIEFNGNKDEWIKWVQEKAEQLQKEENESRTDKSGDSTGGTGDTETGKQASPKQNKKTK